ncbi:MAG: hypothetical protein AVO35_03615 [Candidatus Aegiribacteria sp. MLS_C]|nr:MAG: hypothetical protein AVO35_03615 [Candidatus Aegiribacteria sp. MLS_C]
MNRFPPSARMASVVMPPISGIMGRIFDLRGRGRTVYSMAQAVPWYSPPDRVLQRFRKRLEDPGMHSYSPDPGFLSTREAVASDLAARRGIGLDPEREVQLTCGASQAFLNALLSVTSAGDTVCLIEPYYFDHLFAVQFSDLRHLSIPMEEYGGTWGFPWDGLREKIDSIDVLVLVNPGNPTGAVLTDREMEELVSLTGDSETFLLIDETYERFVFTGHKWHPWMDGGPEHVLTFGSFSKSLGIPGWRLGYLFGSGRFLEQAIKVQDSVVICPPSPAQFLLEEAISEKEWISEMSAGVLYRLNECRKALEANPGFHWRDAGGAFFTLAAYEGEMSSQDAAIHLLEEYGIGTIPGSVFGPAGEGHLRISFGCLAPGEIGPAMELLSEVSVPG